MRPKASSITIQQTLISFSSFPVFNTSGEDLGETIGAIIARGFIGPLDIGGCFLYGVADCWGFTVRIENRKISKFNGKVDFFFWWKWYHHESRRL